MAGFTLHQKGPLAYLTGDLLAAAGLVVHAFTTRQGGLSEGDYAGLNLGLATGDARERVLANRALICTVLGIPAGDLVSGQQVHGDAVAVVTAAHRGRGATGPESALPATDALITAERGVPLVTYHADCVPVFLLDPVRRVAGLVHAGWRGTLLKIAAKAVQAMGAVFGTDPADVLAGIGPCAGTCCYEVDEAVLSRLPDVFPDWPAYVTPTTPGHGRLDLGEANRRILVAAGLDPGRTAVAGMCTCCRRDLFYSYRGEGARTGRMAALMMLL